MAERKTEKRTRYPAWVKDQVKKRYQFCRTTADKINLAAELKILDEDGQPSVSKLYNLASRLRATGRGGAQAEDLVLEDGHALRREDPATTEFSRTDDQYLKAEFGRRALDVIAYHLAHSETALLYRARKLGLRKPVKHWDLEKVSMWLEMSRDEIVALDGELDIHPLANRAGRVEHEVVSTSSLARWIAAPKTLKMLTKRGADKFFLLEIKESMDALIASETEFESCKFLSHGHVCMNPFTPSHGLYCTNNERYRAGEDPVCAVRTLAIEDLRPD